MSAGGNSVFWVYKAKTALSILVHVRPKPRAEKKICFRPALSPAGTHHRPDTSIHIYQSPCSCTARSFPLAHKASAVQSPGIALIITMKLGMAIVAGLSAGEQALAFVPPTLLGSTSTTTTAARSKCALHMKAGGGEERARSIVAEGKSMDRKQMLQSVAAAGFGAMLFSGNPSPSFADTAVDYTKASQLCATKA